MTLQLKKYFFRPAGAMIIFFLLVITETISAQKKSLIKPPDHIKIQYAGGPALLQSEPDIAIRVKNWKAIYIMVIYLKVSEVFAFIHICKCYWIPNSVK
jgi:hypothetical protein